MKSDVAIGSNTLISVTNQGVGDITNAYNSSITEFNTLANQINTQLQSLSFKPSSNNNQPQPDYTIYYIIGGLIIIYIL